MSSQLKRLIIVNLQRAAFVAVLVVTHLVLAAPPGPGSNGPAGHPTQPQNDPASIKGTIGIVCVKNSGEKVTWYPKAVDAPLKASALRLCFDEVARGWDGRGGDDSTQPNDDDGVEMDSEIAFDAMLDVMTTLQVVTP